MGDSTTEPNFLSDEIWEKLIKIKDFLLLMKVVEHLENLQTTDITIFHLCTIVYSEEDLKRLEEIE